MGKTSQVFGALLLFGLLSSCNTEGGASSPHISTIPLQSVGGGATFVLDLSTFVDDDTQTVTYTVVSGGGSFTGSVYSHMFPTLGTYSVTFKVTDFRGQSATQTFQVKVTSAELGVVRNGTGVSLLDLGTGNFASALQDDGQTKSFKAACTNGALVFEVTVTGQSDLWLHDPNVGGTSDFANDSNLNESFVLKSDGDRVLFVRGAAPARSLHLYDPFDEFTVRVSSGKPGRDERDAFLGLNNVIFFESAQSGLADIWAFEITTGKSVVVSNHARDEDMVTVLPNGGLVFRRKGDGGEWDLFYFLSGIGVVEIGTDLGTTKNLETKSFRASTTDSRVVFETMDAGGDEDLYLWNPATGQTSVIAQGAVDETFLAVSRSGRVILRLQTGAGNADIRWFDPSDGSAGSVAATTDDETFNGVLTGGDVIYTRHTGPTGLDLYIWDESSGSARAFPGATTTPTDQVFAKILQNDDVVYTTGSDLFVFRPSTASSTSVATGAGTESFGGETSGGDFLIELVTGGDTHLYLWDSSAGSAVAVSTVSGTAAFQAASSSGIILFARTASGAATSELFQFDPATNSEKQITTNNKDDTVDAVVHAVVN